MTPQEVLLQAADLIERTGWCQRVFAKNASGEQVAATSSDAACFCAGGAIKRVCGGVDRTFVSACVRVEKTVGGVVLPEWNDAPGRTKEDVIATLRRAAQESA